MQRQTAQLVACAMVLAALVVSGVVWFVGARDRGLEAADADRGGGATLDPSHYLRRTAVVRDALHRLAGDAKAGVEPGEYERRLADVTAAVTKWRASLTPEEKEKSSAALVDAAFAGLTSYGSSSRPAATEPVTRLQSVDADLRSLDQALAAGR
jgi:hypothetical protein